MANYKHHSDIIDEFDLKQIISKSDQINQIIIWLKRLKELDSTIDAEQVDIVIKNLSNKKSRLNAKATKAQKDLADEADFLCDIYTGDK